MNAYVMSGHPLSVRYKTTLEDVLGHSLTPVCLNELRDLGIAPMIRRLRDLRGDRLVVAHEDQTGKALRPVLRIAGSLTRAREKLLCDEAHRIARWNYKDLFLDLVLTLWATMAGLYCYGVASLRSRWLLWMPLRKVTLEGNRGLFLSSGQWLGLKAGGSIGHMSGVLNAMHSRGLDMLFCSASGRLMTKPEIRHLQLVGPQSMALFPELNTYRFSETIPEQVYSSGDSFKPCFIYQRLSLGDVSGVRISRALNVPLLLEYNGSEVWAARNWGRPLTFESAPKLAEQACLKHAHLVITVSEALEAELRGRGIEDSRIATYPNCIDPAIFDPSRFSPEDCLRLRARYEIDADAILVTFLGTFGAWHGVPVLAEVVRNLIAERRSWLERHSVRFLFVGDGTRMPDVRRILSRYLTSPYVKLAGLVPQDHAPLYLAASDILTSPHVPNPDGSPFFGSPTKLFEYMAMGKAILASDLDQIGRVLSRSIRASRLPSLDGVANPMAVLCAPGSTEELSRGLEFLVEQPEWRTRLGEAARTEAHAKYTWAHHVEHIFAKLRSLALEP